GLVRATAVGAEILLVTRTGLRLATIEERAQRLADRVLTLPGLIPLDGGEDHPPAGFVEGAGVVSPPQDETFLPPAAPLAGERPELVRRERLAQRRPRQVLGRRRLRQVAAALGVDPVHMESRVAHRLSPPDASRVAPSPKTNNDRGTGSPLPSR